MTIKKPLETGSFVVKSNDLIEARYRLSLQESHVVLWLLTQIRPEDEDFKPHKLEITEFAKMIGVKAGNQYKELRNITKRLMQRVMEIHNNKENKIVQVAWLSSATYETKKGCVLLEFSPQLKPYLLQLKSNFTKIQISDALELRSIHAVRIFELLLQYESIGKRQISVEELRNYCGIEKKEYVFYADFKSRIIERAKNEINTKTPYDIGYTEIKKNRKVVAIEWVINKKTHFEKMQSQKASIIEKEMASKNVLLEAILDYGFSKIMAKRLLKNHEEEVVSNALRAVDLQIKKGNVKNPKAMVQVAIKEQWHPEKYRD